VPPAATVRQCPSRIGWKAPQVLKRWIKALAGPFALNADWQGSPTHGGAHALPETR